MKYLWHRAYLKSKGAAHVLAKFGDLNKKIYLYGAEKKKDEQEDEQAIILKAKRCVIMPDDKIKVYWNLLITALLLYTASYVPYRTAFIDENPNYMIALDTLFDFIFFSDIILCFLSAFETKKLGIEVRHRQIAANYLKSWFFLDIFSW